MNIRRKREARHGLIKAAVFVLPLLAMLGCSSAESGHAPGVAGGQTLTPGITNYPLAYVKRPVPTTDIDVRDLITSVTGGDLYVRDQASAGGAETNVTKSITGGMGDVRDLDVSPDGTKIVFSLRLPLNPKKKNTDVTQPNWKIYQYDASTKVVTQLTTDAGMTWALITCPTGASYSPRRASWRRSPSCSTRAGRSTRRRPTIVNSRSFYCMS
jgi:hypothetical protein